MAKRSWFRLDGSFITNPKILELVDDNQWRAIVVWIAGMGYSCDEKTSGFIPKSALKTIKSTPKITKKLVEIGLWEELPTGFAIHDWDEHQPQFQGAENRSNKAKKAARARWHRGEGNVVQMSG